MEEFETFLRLKENPNYWVTDHGRVFYSGLVGEDRFVSPQINNYGYAYVRVWCANKPRNLYLSTLVLNYFRSPRPTGLQACHFPDATKTNNRVNNLLWGTPLTNSSHAKTQGLTLRGERHRDAKLTTPQVLRIARELSEGEASWRLAERFHVNTRTISAIKTGRTWAWLTGASPNTPLGKPRKKWTRRQKADRAAEPK